MRASVRIATGEREEFLHELRSVIHEYKVEKRIVSALVLVLGHAAPRLPSHVKAISTRVFDLVFLFLALPFLVLLFSFTVLYARVVAGGPVFPHHRRVGRHGCEFTMVKVRTMYMGAAEFCNGRRLDEIDHPAVIPAMAWLRRKRLDELPLVWNVVRGEMSLLDPRENSHDPLTPPP